MPIGDILPELVIIVGAALIVLTAAFIPHRQHGWCALLALLTLAVAAVLAVDQWALTNQLSFKQVWAIDRTAVSAKLMIMAVTTGTIALSPEWLSGDRRHGEYYALVLFASLGAIMLASANGAMELVMAVLLSSAASYPLVAFHRNWSLSTEAGMKYFLVGALANGILLIGVVLLFGLVGDTNYEAVRHGLAAASGPWVTIAAAACIAMGLCFKLAAFPLHVWMPDVAQGAPVPVAALLSIVPKIGAAVALARFVTTLPATIEWHALLAFIAVATMTLANLAALWQNDLRRLLGWSSVSQSGYALMAVAVINLSDDALPALLVFLSAYAVANLALFAVVNTLRGRTDFADLSGLAVVRPLAALVFVVGALSLVGIPPLVGFFGKLTLFRATIDGGYGWLAVVAIANTVISLFYHLRVVQVFYFQPVGDRTIQLLGKFSVATMIGTGIGVLVLGLAVQMLLWVLQTASFATGVG